MSLDPSTFGHRLPADKKINKEERDQHLLIEAAWEVCNQVGGIYTVIRSKVPSVLKKWKKENYCLMGPYINKNVDAVFEPIIDLDLSNPIDRAVKQMWDWGYEVHYGTWLITGKPKVVLFNPFHVYDRLDNIKTEL